MIVPPIHSANHTHNIAARTHNAIADASAKTGIDFNFLMHQARIESGMNPDARAPTSSASGLFQFTNQTWLGTVKAHGADHGLGWASDAISVRKGGGLAVQDSSARGAIMQMRMQPEAAAIMAAELASDNYDYLSGQLGREPEQVDLYLAHFLGESAAAKFLQAYDQRPADPAATNFPAAAAANKAVFYNPDGSSRSFKDIRDKFASQFSAGSTAVFMAGSPVSQKGNLINSTNFISTSRSPQITQPLQLQMRVIEPMPQRLSLEFAQTTYRRLAELGQFMTSR